MCARTNPWFRGQTLLVLGHGGGGGGNSLMVPGRDQARVPKTEADDKVRARAVEAEAISAQGWVDTWEFVHDKEDPPPGWTFDFKARDGGHPRRLDRIHVPWELTPHVGGVFASLATKSDHKTVVLRLVPAVDMGATRRWRFPEELLKDEESLHSLGEQLASVQGTGEEWWGAAHRVPRDAARSWDRKQAAVPAPMQQIVRKCSPSSVSACGWHYLWEKGL